MCLPLRYVVTNNKHPYLYCCLKMWEPQPPATLRASTACTGITLPFTFYLYCCVRVSRFLRFNSSRMKETRNNIIFLRDMLLYRLADRYRRFGGTGSLRLHSRRISCSSSLKTKEILSREAIGHSANQVIICLLYEPKFCYCVIFEVTIINITALQHATTCSLDEDSMFLRNVSYDQNLVVIAITTTCLTGYWISRVQKSV
jgi:hypothetical protein